MQLPECMWKSWLTSGSPVWWIPPFHSRCLICCLQTAFQTVNAEEEEGHACFVLSSNYLVVLTSVFLEDANFTNSLHLTFQPPVICSLDKTGLQTSVIADCLHLLTLSTWTPTEPILNRCVKNKSSYKSFFPSCIVFFLSHCLPPFSY